MKTNYFIRLSIVVLILAGLASSCKIKKKDCRGRRKQVKTDMGGWL